MASEKHPTRKDGISNQRLIWFLSSTLVTVLIIAITGFFSMNSKLIATETKADEALKKIDKLEKLQSEISRSMSSIDSSVKVLVALAEVRNNQQIEVIKKQGKILEKQIQISDEQISRTDVIVWGREQMAKTYKR